MDGKLLGTPLEGSVPLPSQPHPCAPGPGCQPIPCRSKTEAQGVLRAVVQTRFIPRLPAPKVVHRLLKSKMHMHRDAGIPMHEHRHVITDKCTLTHMHTHACARLTRIHAYFLTHTCSYAHTRLHTHAHTVLS